MLLGDGQGGTVDPLVNLFPFLRLEGVEPFPSITHPGDGHKWHGGQGGGDPTTHMHLLGWALLSSRPSGEQAGLSPSGLTTQLKRAGHF